ncbi:hypothetical protein FXO38_26685 [Capsicum annuum]|nr:hypothetical protein FXO38_26685 [Capsicum annuum]
MPRCSVMIARNRDVYLLYLLIKLKKQTANGHLTPKSDIYTFDGVLLELLMGRKSLDKSRPAREQNHHKAAMLLLHRWIDEINFLL